MKNIFCIVIRILGFTLSRHSVLVTNVLKILSALGSESASYP